MVPNFEKAESIYFAALNLPKTQQAEFIRAKCAGDDALCAQIEAMILARADAKSFLEHGALAFDGAADGFVDDLVGSQIGPYTLREQIGEGGMGIVYVAEQIEPVRRKVALKVIKPGMASSEVVARFETERQALAMMEHPNIAHVFDGGVTDSGQPYFAMELVQGLPINEFCEEHKLMTEDRLRLFLDVCRAVHHAHQKGIIHRDLKPSNVLVAEIDGQLVPKVIDFGVAKAVGEQLIERTLYTNFGQIVGTPLYMSPEQASMGVIDVDTQSDVYSLGIVLYEILTGVPPFDAEALKRAGFDEMRRIIREIEPLPPSAKVSTVKADGVSTSANKQAKDLRELRLALQGELDWIVMKALEKDRSRRYASANEFGLDLERFLKNEPVVAKSASAFYRAKKLVARNRVAVMASAAVVIAVLTGLVLATIGYVSAQRQLAENKILIDILGDMYGGTQWASIATHTPNRTIRDALDETNKNLSEKLRDHPRIEIKVRGILAHHYREVQNHPKSKEQALRALELAEELYGESSLEVADVLQFLASEFDVNGFPVDFDFTRTRAYARRALDIHNMHGIRSNATAGLWYCLAASLASDPYQQEAAEQAYREALSIRPHAFSIADLALFLARHKLQSIDEAVDLMATAVARSRSEHGEKSGKHATILRMQGDCFRRRGNPGDNDRALNCFEHAWRIYKEISHPSEPVGYLFGLHVAEVHLVEHRHTEAAKILDEIEVAARSHAVTDALAHCLFLKGWGELYRDDLVSAEKYLSQVLQEAEKSPDAMQEIAAFARFYLAKCLVATHRTKEAADLFGKNVVLTRPRFRNQTANSTVLYGHAWACLHTGNDTLISEANQAIDRGLTGAAIESQKFAMPHFFLAKAIATHKSGNLNKAIESIKQGLAVHNDLATPFQSTSWKWIPTTGRELEVTLAKYYLEQSADNLEKAKQVFLDGIARRTECLGARHLSVALAELRFGTFLLEQQQFKAAQAQLETAFFKLRDNRDAAQFNVWTAAMRLASVCDALEQHQEREKWNQTAKQFSTTAGGD